MPIYLALLSKLVTIVNPFKVMVKLPVQLGNGSDLLVSEFDFCVSINDSLEILTLRLEFGQSQCCLTGISNLSAIPPHSVLALPFEAHKMQDLFLVEIDRLILFLKLFANASEIELEDLQCGLKLEILVVEADINSRGKSFVKVSDTVCRGEENSVVVLQYPQEHRNQTISCEILWGS